MDALKLVEGRETGVLTALGIQWHNRAHIRCPFPDHNDAHPSWRWDHAKQRWYCTCGSGSVVDAVMRMRRVTFAEACTFVREVCGGTPYVYSPAANFAENKPADTARKYIPATHAPKPAELHHSKLGAPVQIWIYHTAERLVAEVRARYEYTDTDGTICKEVRPWTWNGTRWINKAAPAPRPLYALPSLLGDTDAPVLFVEGEKTATAAEERFPDYQPTTTSGGANAAAFTDYSPLSGRHVVIWPDNDAPGYGYAQKVAMRLHEIGAASIAIVNIPHGWPDGWDLADPLPDGVSGADLPMLLATATPWQSASENAPADTEKVVPFQGGRQTQRHKRASLRVYSNDRIKTEAPPAGTEAFPDDGFHRNPWSGEIVKSVENMLIALQKLGVTVSYNEFSCRYYVDGLPGYGPMLSDDALDAIYVEMWRRFGLKPARRDLDAVVLSEAKRHGWHPVRAYLASLEWDGVERMDEWLCTYLAAENDAAGLNRAIGRMMLIAAVRRIRQPGCKFDPLLVLEGPQGCGESSAVAALCPDRAWFSDSISMHMSTKEVTEIIGGKWLVELSELSGMRRSDVEHIKALISRQVDEARVAYARSVTSQPRQCIFIGTTNKTNYLMDDTGNRRFLPVRVGQIDIAALRRDRDQLWAEAAHFEALGEALELPKHLYDEATAAQLAREEEDEWEGLVLAWLDSNYPASKDAFREQRVTLVQVATGTLDIELGRFDSVLQKRLARCMRKSGWTRAVKSNGHWYWERTAKM